MKSEDAVSTTDALEPQGAHNPDQAGDPAAPAAFASPPLQPAVFKNDVAKKLLHGSIQGGDFVRTVWCITPDAGTTIEDIMNPEFYAHVVRSIKIGDKLEAIPDDSVWYAELLVMDIGPGFAKVALLRHVELEAIDPRDELAGMTIEFAGRKQKYRVLRGGKVLEKGFPTQSKAREWAERHMRRIAS